MRLIHATNEIRSNDLIWPRQWLRKKLQGIYRWNERSFNKELVNFMICYQCESLAWHDIMEASVIIMTSIIGINGIFIRISWIRRITSLTRNTWLELCECALNISPLTVISCYLRWKKIIKNVHTRIEGTRMRLFVSSLDSPFFVCLKSLYT